MVNATWHVAAIRFGLGPRLGEAPPADPRAWLGAQLGEEAPLPPGPSAGDGLRARAEDILDRNRSQGQLTGPTRAGQIARSTAQAWASRRLAAAAPFRERLVDFWMNHLTASRRSGQLSFLVGAYEREAIRPHVTGRFADMLVAAVLHPAMLIYLNADSSVGPNSAFGQRSGRGLNENLAREVLELHTLSPSGGYTQGDVTEFARLLTGWSVAQRAEPFGTIFRRHAHDPGAKRVLGRPFEEGPEAAEAALRFLAAQPATHRHLAVKLARHFVADDPPPAAIRTIEAALRDSDGDLGAAARALLALEAAWEPPLGKLRTPGDYVLALCRATALPEDRPEVVLNAMAALGQPLWTAPQPIGWPDHGEAWAAPEAIMRRVDWAHTLAGRLQALLEPRAVAAAVLGPLARAETVTAVDRAGSPRDALTLVFSSPEFMRR